MKRAVFFDRDGILNAVVRRDGRAVSPRHLEDFQLIPEAREAVLAAREKGFLAIVATNQPDIGRGLMSPAVLDEMHARLRAFLPVDDIETATSGDDADPRRKPNPGMLLDAARTHALDLSACWIVGDSDKDLAAGRRAGVGTILLETDYNKTIHGQGMYNFRSVIMIASFLRSL